MFRSATGTKEEYTVNIYYNDLWGLLEDRGTVKAIAAYVKSNEYPSKDVLMRILGLEVSDDDE